MSRLLLAGAATAFILFLPGLRASERWETLEAIHSIENPHNSPQPGRFGELGAYQFRESTWRTYTSVPFRRALDRQASDDVAVRHYEWIKERLVRNGFEVTPYNVALAWNGGVSALLRSAVPATTRDYAQRVSNVAQNLHQTRLESALQISTPPKIASPLENSNQNQLPVSNFIQISIASQPAAPAAAPNPFTPQIAVNP